MGQHQYDGIGSRRTREDTRDFSLLLVLIAGGGSGGGRGGDGKYITDTKLTILEQGFSCG